MLATLAVWLGLRARTDAGEPRETAGSLPIDAIFVERTPAWWLVDDGARRAATPRWVADRSAARGLGADVIRDMLDAIETGEGGGYADETGLGPPPPPTPASACGIALVATTRDVAVVFLRDEHGSPLVFKASRVADSRDRTSPTEAIPRAHRDRGGADAPEPLDAARWRALVGDATGTLRQIVVARAQAAPGDTPSLNMLEAQALERLGRFGEAADILVRYADGIANGTRDPRRDSTRAAGAAEEARRRANRLRERTGDPLASTDGADELDVAFGAVPALVGAGRPLDAVARVVKVVRVPHLASIRSITRRRALLAATALALDAGDTGSARVLLGAVANGRLAGDLEPILDALSARARSVGSGRAGALGPATGSPDPGK